MLTPWCLVSERSLDVLTSWRLADNSLLRQPAGTSLLQNSAYKNFLQTPDKLTVESESYVTTDGQSASLSWYKAPIWGLRPDFFSVRNTEYVWQLRSWFRGTPSLTRGRVCLLYVPVALASAVFLGRSPLGLATVFYCLRFETSLFVASYDSN
jgi:hypothetical protein